MRAFISIMGEDFVAECEVKIHSYGAPACWDDPGYGPEYDFTSITLRRDMPGQLGPAFEATGALFRCLAWDDKLNDQIIEQIGRDAAERRWQRRKGARYGRYYE